nr:MAG TPA: hypothetical protein [Caudoviricetes sp.]
MPLYSCGSTHPKKPDWCCNGNYPPACGSGTQSAAVGSQFVPVGCLPLYIWHVRGQNSTHRACSRLIVAPIARICHGIAGI